MRILEGDPAAWPAPRAPGAVTIGVYDGVHRGHQHVIRRLGERAAGFGELLTVVTFRRHPALVVAPDRVPPQLTTLSQRLEQLEALGVEVVALLDFDERLRRLDAVEFVTDVLVAKLRPAVISVGEDFRFGYRQQGDVDLLARLGKEHGFEVVVQPLVGADGRPYSASAARRAVTSGDLETAASVLGRPFQLRAEVVRGAGRGAGIGFPTANLEVGAHQAVPPRGVYAVRVRFGDEPSLRHGVVNIGVRPTFDGATEIVEVHVLDFAGDLYRETVSIDFVTRIREERRFEGVDALVTQIGADVAAARELLATTDRPG